MTRQPAGRTASVEKAGSGALLAVADLHTYFFLERKTICAVNGVSFELNEGEALAIVGESGCGKSVTALSIMRLLQSPPARIVRGAIRFEGESLLDLPASRMRRIRGARIAMIFQDPMTSLNPVFTVGDQIAEAALVHQRIGRREAWRKAVEMMEMVRIPNAAARARQYPHQFSGGMRQRAMIAMALSCEPSVLIADEPTTALDVTIQAQILDLLKTLRKEKNISLILISHNLGVVADLCDRTLVMYGGRVVEESPTADLFLHPSHPYTRGLLKCLPRLEGDREQLRPIPGVPDMLSPGENHCPFGPRCDLRVDDCGRMPDREQIAPGHYVRCRRPERPGEA